MLFSLFLYMYASLLSRNQLLMERICSYGSKFSPLRVDPILEGRRRGSHKSCFLYEMAGKHDGVPIHLKDFLIKQVVFSHTGNGIERLRCRNYMVKYGTQSAIVLLSDLSLDQWFSKSKGLLFLS